MRNTSGTTLTEVMVMMVILGVSLTGIFGLVNSGQKLASLTDTRLTAVNIAREGLEAVTTLRDTFSLASFSSGECTNPPNPTNKAFFTITGHQIFDMPTPELDNCPVVVTSPAPPAPPATPPPPDSTTYPYYILWDDKVLNYKANTTDGGTEVCMNEYGWYSQEYSFLNSLTLAECRMGGAGCIVCTNAPTSCSGNTTQSCKTRFQRKITFQKCINGSAYLATDLCIVATSTVWWGDASDETISLTQLITVK